MLRFARWARGGHATATSLHAAPSAAETGADAEPAAPVIPPGQRQFYLPRLRTFESLQFRDYRLLWLGQFGTSMGQWMDQVARTWLIYQITGSALQLGMVSAMRAIPMLFFSVIAGVVADRYGRKAQLIISQVTNVLINVVLATLILTGRIEIWHIYVTALLAGTVQAFQQPARQSLISDLVGKRHLANAVALNSAVLNLTRSVGPAVAGALIAIIGVDGSYYFQAVLFMWATIWTMQMHVPGETGLLEMLRLRRSKTPEVAPEPKPETPAAVEDENAPSVAEVVRRRRPQGSFTGNMREGFTYLFSNRLLLSLMFLGLAPMVLGMPFSSLMPIFAEDILKVGAVGQGFLLASVGVGALIGALGIASMGTFKHKGVLLLAGATLFGVGLALFSRSTSMVISMGMLFVAGLSNASYTSQDQTIIQTITPDHLRGRVLSIYLLNRGLMPLGSLLAGALATWLGGPSAVLVMGVSCAILAIGVAVGVPEIRDLEI